MYFDSSFRDYNVGGTVSAIKDVVFQNVVSSQNYEVNTVPPEITMDDVSDNNFVFSTEDDTSLLITGGTRGVAEGTVVTVTLGDKTYAGEVSNAQWFVQVGVDDVRNLEHGDNTASVSVTNGNNVELTAEKKIVYESDDVLTIRTGEDSLAINGTSLVTFTFGKAVEGFSLDDITVKGGTLSNLTSTDQTTWTATFTATTTISSQLAENIFVGYEWDFTDGSFLSSTTQATFFETGPVGMKVDVLANSITATEGAPRVWDAGIFSEQVIYGDGSVSVKYAGLVKEGDDTAAYGTIRFGLSASNDGGDISCIDYGIQTWDDCLEVWEFNPTTQQMEEIGRVWDPTDPVDLGTYEGQTTSSALTINDILSVRRTGTTIEYLRGDEVLYTSTKECTADAMHFDGIFRDVDATLEDIFLESKYVPVFQETAAPLVIDLNGNGVEYVSLDESRVLYDMDGDGALELTAWADPHDALLAYDANGNGRIAGREELVFTDYSPGAKTDLEGLRGFFDTNLDGLLNAADEEWSSLRLWEDKNSDGVSDPGEVQTLEEGNIKEIELKSDETASRPAAGVLEHGQFVVQLADGGQTRGGDAEFTMREVAGSASDPDYLLAAHTGSVDASMAAMPDITTTPFLDDVII